MPHTVAISSLETSWLTYTHTHTRTRTRTLTNTDTHTHCTHALHTALGNGGMYFSQGTFALGQNRIGEEKVKRGNKR